jgi:release factor glutamine methyltransferase
MAVPGAVLPAPESLVGTRPSLQVALQVGTRTLQAAGVERARVEAEWLLAATLGVSRTALAVQGRQALEPPAAERYAAALRRRMGREPLQHILGTQAFRHLTLTVGPQAMVPRPETEVLAGWALALLPPPSARPTVVDVGTGSGCIACALAAERPDAVVVGIEISPAAAALARANVTALGLSSRVRVEVGDLLAGLPARSVDLIVSNPPYLPSGLIDTLAPEVSRHDPRVALDGGGDGLDLIRRLVQEAPGHLVSGGVLVLETAGDEQVRSVAELLRAQGFARIEACADLAGVERFVAGRRA